ncbi:hypothetical protein [Nonomuraea roseoviolacea]|uniref:Uncharacterized protein n=1 Tax=Nonomuraea roseoviolacea subsp. carminata TaxID=160689 RepID=A0ABT1JX56_9ACTN|nr:hypothetical protein [Nonomuraea roseoviolacea]MCP2346337.1 hypothetical protein [Nonomuraea roseoviolacea subsp. carminata]
MVFAACQPSYHMRQERNGKWALRAVLSVSVSVPGHPSRLAASAVIGRANLALAASATPASAPPLPGVDIELLAAAGVDELKRRAEVRAWIDRLAAELAPARAEIAASTAAHIKGGA